MKERPIIFSDPMVRAVLAGCKTQTRRVMRPQPPEGAKVWDTCDGYFKVTRVSPHRRVLCPYGRKGDRLYVREAFHFGKGYDPDDFIPGLSAAEVPTFAKVHYGADGRKPEWAGRRRPSIHMPKWTSRILLEVQEIRVERVQDIPNKDAVAEGIQSVPVPYVSVEVAAGANEYITPTPVSVFSNLWNSINDHRGYGWDANPWVWVVSFKVLQKERIRA